MDVTSMVAIATRVILFGTFALSAVAKLLAFATTKDSFRELGVPEKLLALTLWSVIVLELLIAVLLVVSESFVRLTAIFALVLLITFTMVMIGNLMVGRRPTCACFGTLGPSRIGKGSVMRNLALIGIALTCALSA